MLDFHFQAQIILNLCDAKFTPRGTPTKLAEALETLTLVDESIIAFCKDPMSFSESGSLWYKTRINSLILMHNCCWYRTYTVSQKTHFLNCWSEACWETMFEGRLDFHCQLAARYRRIQAANWQWKSNCPSNQVSQNTSLQQCVFWNTLYVGHKM